MPSRVRSLPMRFRVATTASRGSTGSGALGLARAAFFVAAGIFLIYSRARLRGNSVAWSVHHLTDLDDHAQGFSTGTGRRRKFGSDRLRALGTVHVHDPVASEELLRLREHAVREHLAVFAGTHVLGLIGRSERLYADQLARLPQATRKAL